jgi:hypothetical protein
MKLPFFFSALGEDEAAPVSALAPVSAALVLSTLAPVSSG